MTRIIISENFYHCFLVEKEKVTKFEVLEIAQRFNYLCLQNDFLEPKCGRKAIPTALGFDILRPFAFQGRDPKDRSRTDSRWSALLNVGDEVLRLALTHSRNFTIRIPHVMQLVRRIGLPSMGVGGRLVFLTYSLAVTYALQFVEL